jgi:hypothetical protein
LFLPTFKRLAHVWWTWALARSYSHILNEGVFPEDWDLVFSTAWAQHCFVSTILCSALNLAPKRSIIKCRISYCAVWYSSSLPHHMFLVFFSYRRTIAQPWDSQSQSELLLSFEKVISGVHLHFSFSCHTPHDIEDRETLRRSHSFCSPNPTPEQPTMAPATTTSTHPLSKSCTQWASPVFLSSKNVDWPACHRPR